MSEQEAAVVEEASPDEAWDIALSEIAKAGEADSLDHTLAHLQSAIIWATAAKNEGKRRLDEAETAIRDLLASYPTGCDGLGCAGWDDHAKALSAAVKAPRSDEPRSDDHPCQPEGREDRQP